MHPVPVAAGRAAEKALGSRSHGRGDAPSRVKIPGKSSRRCCFSRALLRMPRRRESTHLTGGNFGRGPRRGMVIAGAYEDKLAGPTQMA